jgi:competence protein ComGC
MIFYKTNLDFNEVTQLFSNPCILLSGDIFTCEVEGNSFHLIYKVPETILYIDGGFVSYDNGTIIIVRISTGLLVTFGCYFGLIALPAGIIFSLMNLSYKYDESLKTSIGLGLVLLIICILFFIMLPRIVKSAKKGLDKLFDAEIAVEYKHSLKSIQKLSEEDFANIFKHNEFVDKEK